MIQHGTIVSYDQARRAGLIRPEGGGTAILFQARQSGSDVDPRMFERVTYEVMPARDGGLDRAVNLNGPTATNRVGSSPDAPGFARNRGAARKRMTEGC